MHFLGFFKYNPTRNNPQSLQLMRSVVNLLTNISYKEEILRMAQMLGYYQKKVIKILDFIDEEIIKTAVPIRLSFQNVFNFVS